MSRADVVVVGGGITGLTAAYLLLAAGRSVVVLERRRMAESDTGHTSAHLTMVTDLPMTDLVKQFGRDHAQAVWDAGLAAIDQIDQIVRDEHIACDFMWVPGYLHAAADRASADADWLREEARLAEELGFDATFVENVPWDRDRWRPFRRSGAHSPEAVSRGADRRHRRARAGGSMSTATQPTSATIRVRSAPMATRCRATTS